MSSINSPEAADVLVELHRAAEEEWHDPEEFKMMLNLAASDAGMSDDLIGEVGQRLDAESAQERLESD